MKSTFAKLLETTEIDLANPIYASHHDKLIELRWKCAVILIHTN